MQGEATFLIELGLVLIALGLVGALALRIGLSAAPLFLLAGLLIAEGGPASLSRAQPFLESAATVGVVLLLLALGLEFSASEFHAALRRHAWSGVVDFVFNAVPGFLAGLALGWSVVASLCLAGITWVSSSGIVAKVLSDLGRLGFRETPAVLSVLVLEDIAMAGYLPLIGVLMAGGGLIAGLAGAVFSLVLVTAILILARRGERVAERLLNSDSDEQVLLRILGLTLLMAGVAELLGISMAVGAFLVGLAVPGRAAERARAIIEPLRNFFAAMFFLAFGAETDMASIGPVLPAAVLLALLTAVTKIATGWYAARRDGAAVRGRLRAGTVLVSRGEFSIVIAGLAVAAGFEGVGPMATAYVLLLALLGPTLTRFSDSLIPNRWRVPAGSSA